jgi:hypothetical protein
MRVIRGRWREGLASIARWSGPQFWTQGSYTAKGYVTTDDICARILSECYRLSAEKRPDIILFFGIKE